MRAVAELLTHIPSVVYAPPPTRTIGPKLLDRFVSFPGSSTPLRLLAFSQLVEISYADQQLGRGGGSEHVLFSHLDPFVCGLSRLPFAADPYLDRVFTIGVYSRCLSLSSGSNLPQEAPAVRQKPKEPAQKMRILARAAWMTPARGGEEVRRWLSRATGQLLATAASPLAYHLLTFASALLEERRSRLRYYADWSCGCLTV